MKHVGIDARLLFQTGVGTYLQNLIHSLAKCDTDGFTFTVYCRTEDSDFVRKEFPQARIHEANTLWHSMGEQIRFMADIYGDNLDLMHFTYFGHPVLYNRPFIATIHDVTPLLFKTGRASTKDTLTYAVKHAAFSLALKNQVTRSRSVITPTRTVKEQLIHLYGGKYESKIAPIHEGVSYRLTEVQGEQTDIGKPYLLYVGNFYPHKNVKMLMSAFAENVSPYSLVLAGPRGFFLDKLLASCSNAETRNIIIKDKPSLPELVGLYKGAEALIHPSLSEGFGLPIVEAMHFGKPIIASHIPVFQELLGTSFYSFDPYDVRSIRFAVNRFLDAKKKQVNTLNPDFSFIKMTERTMDLYKAYA